MAFGFLVISMAVGLIAATAMIPAGSGLLFALLVYSAVGVLTLLIVVLAALATDPEHQMQADAGAVIPGE